MKRLLAAALLILIAAFLWSARMPGSPRHQVFWGGSILTMNGGEVAEAIYVRDGLIAAVGSMEDVRAAAPWHAARTHLEGGTLLPGLIEPHSHPLASALLGAVTDIGGVSHTSRAGVMETLRDAASRRGPTPWIMAFGWDPAMIEDLAPPSLDELDTISPHRPLVILTQMMHEAFVNSAALEAAGIDADTPDPAGGHFERDGSGRPTGRIIEVGAIQHLMSAAPEAPDAALIYLLSRQYDRYAEAGYTTVAAMGLVGRARDPLAVMAEVASHDRSVLNTIVYTPPDAIDDAMARWPTTDRNAISALGGIKIWMDGSPYVGGAALAEPYTSSRFTREVMALDADWRGTLTYPANDADALIARAQETGIQVAIHAQGERAIDQALDAIEAAQTAHPQPDLHHRLEHLALITPEQIARANRLGISLGFFIDHIRFYGHILPEIVGEARTARYMPVGSAVHSGSVVTLHGDHPATPVNALRVLTTAIERRARLSGDIIGADQHICTERTLQMMTIDAARQLGLDAQIGSIETGKRADLTWLSGNPLNLTPGEIRQLEIRGTWIAGRRTDTRIWTLKTLGLMLSALLASL